MTRPIGSLSRQDEDAIWSKARNLPLPQYIVVPAIKDFLKWGSSSGWEFAISRLKTMKTNLIRIQAGLEPIWGIGYYPSKGISWYKGLVTLSKRGEREFSLAVSLLNVYTSIIFSERTANQMQKFTSGVEAPAVAISAKFTGALLNAATQLERPKSVEKAKWFLDRSWSSTKRTPSVTVREDGSLDYYATAPEVGGVYDSTLQLLAGVRGHEILDLIEWTPDFEGVLDGLGLFDNASLVEKLGSQVHSKVGLLGGTISFIQEAGGKLRSVANPYRWWQAALDPLARSIHDLLKTIPWDATHSQIGPVASVQQSLQNGDEWFSVDISSATDHFPLDYQISVLEYLYQSDPIALGQIRLFRTVSRMDWWYKDLKGKIQKTRYSKGQPMGLRPSFGSFALTHGLVLLALNQGKWEEDFFVLGDDVIIRGEELHRKYRHFLYRHDIPVSESKTLRGGMAEFASLLITPSAVVPIYKWRKSDDDNFVDLARLWGPESLPLFRKEEQKVLKKLASVPPIYGGLGWGDPTLWNYSVPRWIGTQVGQLHDPSGLSSYLKQVYLSKSVSNLGILPKAHEVSGYGNVLTDMVYRVTGLSVTNDSSFLRSMASNVVELLDVYIPYAELDGNIKTKLTLWKQRLGID